MLESIGAILGLSGVWLYLCDKRNKACLPLLLAGLLFLGIGAAFAHDASRPELNGWYDHLASGKGSCCSNADGTAVVDADWDSKAGHYRVRIEGEWWDVPENAVITEPNRDGRTIVWPIYYRNGGKLDRIEIRCFMVGPLG
jgi:hypothetical protein